MQATSKTSRLVSGLLSLLVAVSGVSTLGAVIASPAHAQGALAYDADHDLLVLPDSDVAVRFNNKTFVPVKVQFMPADYTGFMKVSPTKAVRIYEDFASANMKNPPEQIYVESYDVGKIGASGISRFSKDLMANNRVREVQFTNPRVGKEVGLADNAFIGINSVKSYEVAPKNGETPFYLYVILTGPKMTVYARKMRGTNGTFENDPAVIVTQVQFGKMDTANGNVQWPVTQ